MLLAIGFLIVDQYLFDDVETSNAAISASRAADTAIAMLGTPYRFGGSTPAGFDCSALVHYAYGTVGIALPRTTTAAASLEGIRMREVREGDLLFFEIDSSLTTLESISVTVVSCTRLRPVAKSACRNSTTRIGDATFSARDGLNDSRARARARPDSICVMENT